MKCPECVEEGERSRVSVGLSSTTLMGYSSYYDEDGVYHSHDPNRHTNTYSCSRGHSWAESRLIPCLAEGCDHGRSE